MCPWPCSIVWDDSLSTLFCYQAQHRTWHDMYIKTQSTSFLYTKLYRPYKTLAEYKITLLSYKARNFNLVHLFRENSFNWSGVWRLIKIEYCDLIGWKKHRRLKIPAFRLTNAPHCRKKIGDVLIVSEQVQMICRPLGIRIDQFVEH